MPDLALAGYVTFPGINQIVSCDYTLSHGITPGLVSIQIAPQANFTAAGGPVTFYSFEQPIFTLTDCRVDKHSIRTNLSGQVWLLSLQDRRWKWSFGIISGHYNERQDDGTIDPATQQSAQMLASLCLQAMSEIGYDVSQMPPDAYPLIQWEAENPAQALAALCDQFGCRVVFGIDSLVYVRKVGFGQDLPVDFTIMENSLSINPAERPDSLEFICAKTRYQVDLQTQAVGQDTDGSIKPINSLSYMPAGGWNAENPLIFSGVSGTPNANNIIPRDLAKQTVYRWYQITGMGPNGQPLQLPGSTETVSDKKLISPIEDILVVTGQDENGNPLSRPAEVYGTFWDGGTGFNNVAANTRYKKDFSIDRDRGIVKFGERVIQAVQQMDKSYQFQPATITLRTAVSLKDSTTRAWDRYTKTYTYPGQQWGTGPRLLLHDEIVLNRWPNYDQNNMPILSGNNSQVNSNQTDVDAVATYYILAANLDYQLTSPYSIKYAGLRAIQPDGAIQQVSWHMGLDGSITTASKNNEVHFQVPTYQERRLWERLRSDNLKNAISAATVQRAAKDKPVDK